MSDEKRRHVHAMWAGVAEQWTERADFLDNRAAAVTKALLDGAAIGTGDRVLVLADGPGGLGWPRRALPRRSSALTWCRRMPTS